MRNLLILTFFLLARWVLAGDIFLYVSIKNDNKIGIYKLDTATGNLSLVEKFTVTGGPAALAMDKAKKHLYVAQRSAKTISSFSVNQQTGKLTLLNTIAAVDDPVNVGLDHTEKYLFSAYYNASKAAIYPLNENGSISTPFIRSITTGTNPHAIFTDPSNRFLYISIKTGDKIELYPFNANTGDIDVTKLETYTTPATTGPRHFVFHSKLPLVYFSNELSNGASVYGVDPKTGVLTHLQTLPSLPSSFTGTNTVADIHLSRNEQFLYVSNRGHNSIAAFKVNPSTGLLTSINQYTTVTTPRAFDIDPTGNFLFVAGEASANLATYRINQNTGELTLLGPYLTVGNSPSWVLGVEFPSTVTALSTTSIASVLSFTAIPNPLVNGSHFSFRLSKQQQAQVKIFDSKGQQVKSLIDSSLSAGEHYVWWDGTDASNKKVSAGTYSAQLEAEEGKVSCKVVVP